MATIEYGKELKIIRVRKDELSQEMAERLSITPPLLSAIESGARKIPVGFTEKVAKEYKLSAEEIKRLKEAESKSERNAVQINFKKLAAGDVAKHTILQFADKIENLSKEDCEKIMEILGVKPQ